MKSLITAAAVAALTGAVVPWSLSAQHTSTGQPPQTSTEIVEAPPIETYTTETVEVKKVKPQVTVIKRHTTTAETVSPATVESGTTAPGPTTTALPVPVETTAPPAPEPAPAPAPSIVYVPAPAPEPVATAGEAPAPMPEPAKKLPKTASPLALMLLSAVGAFSGAGVMRVLRRRQS